MKAVLVEEKTRRLYIGEAEDPVPKEDELLVSVYATALNRADLVQKRGLYPPPPGTTDILGLEMAGVVEKVGKHVTGWKPGDRVCSLLPGGGYAEKVVIPAEMAIRIPDSFSFEEAAAIPEVFLTAYLNLFWLGGLKAGHTVLIHAGASGVGTAAIQLVREAGAISIVTAGTETKRTTCLELGASLALDYKAGPFAPAVKEATNGKGVNIILDFIGAPYWEQNLSSLAIDGRLIIIGIMGGSKVPALDLGQLLRRRLQVIGTALRSRSVADKIALTKEFTSFAMPRFQDGRLKPIIDSVWDWEQAQEAHEYMESNKNTGKIVLQIKK
ncbi:NAD(P)H-quinone oxidoreductase [Aneurinibacillus thermoaerophilus]|uniref:Putative NAD(P)H quinone oxidoreductase, PIG3 family n=1 Tax=Aneurinibacillus thermoaerophilus TaxID=143495 RepID=A0A1G8CQN8_ANETH|nr:MULTISPECIES: NAD(P)H-quinone oxidoreductase [Aneurinibacillus]AMA71844.1 NADPH:quinone oxidoreductase [Aneurinibacillus sp. XH2]MED0677210.1 NAD(P)H-quinone oxidoreductase [Aneurinibacillus thermoaerophilus]MED0757927.1 NAD(P)H-quinone oxidoreductase [Aneurinibacillus thermoaerophilus]MED0761625.1 NAD(P)H-quinone oxidoreductase [Aneurinibacillus thermoaerophilus]SDH47643.1 putative NAD(P)H quinone oxidoreductase, PIG3 family [Aneurinibacillus thermoaerophilus]